MNIYRCYIFRKSKKGSQIRLGGGGGDRGSGARGWEDRSYGGASPETSSYDEGRTRRRRGGAAPEGEGGDSYSGYGGAEG